MPTSEARIKANRENAKKSTGPRTAEGKARSRCNALKHGLTGSGVALPTEDQAEITRCFAAMQAEFLPSTELAEKLVRRAAFLSVRLERSEKHETAETSRRIRHAVEKFDDERLAAVEALAATIQREPSTTSRRLQTTPEGIDWLLAQWDILLADLVHKGRDCWSTNHWSRFEMLLGRNPADWRIGRIYALSQAVDGSFFHLDPADGEGLEGPDRAEWARGELKRMMDVEMTRLQEARIKLNPDAIAADRREAVDRALFDPSPEAVLARKYEAATERALFRTLKELRQVEAEAARGEESDVTVDEEEACEEMGSNLQGTDPEATEDAPEPSPSPDREPPTIFPLLERRKEARIEAETVENGPG